MSPPGAERPSEAPARNIHSSVSSVSCVNVAETITHGASRDRGEHETGAAGSGSRPRCAARSSSRIPGHRVSSRVCAGLKSPVSSPRCCAAAAPHPQALENLLCQHLPWPRVKLLLKSVCSFQRAPWSGTDARPGPEQRAVKLLDTYLLQLIIYDYKLQTFSQRCLHLAV